MIGTIVKPSIGLSPDELGELVGELAAAGVDFIKDDELQGNGPTAPLAERVRAVMPVLERHADRTGVKPMYAFNITDDIDRLEANHDLVVAAGGTCVMVVRQPRRARRDSSTCGGARSVPIHGHRTMFGAISRSEQVGFVVPRVAEARAPVRRRPPAHQRHQQQVLRIRRRGARIDRGRARAAARPHADRAGALVAASGAGSPTPPTPRSGRPTCSCSPAAASTVIPDGSAAGVASMREAWESAARGETAEDALAASAALRRATEIFGPVRV